MATIPKMCGTCQSIRWKGANALIQVTGQCAKVKDSERPYVRFTEAPCPFYKPMSTKRWEADEAKRKAAETLVNAMNKVSKGRRRSG